MWSAEDRELGKVSRTIVRCKSNALVAQPQVVYTCTYMRGIGYAES